MTPEAARVSGPPTITKDSADCVYSPIAKSDIRATADKSKGSACRNLLPVDIMRDNSQEKKHEVASQSSAAATRLLQEIRGSAMM